MNNLKALKERLQIVLNSSTESEDYKESLVDALYSCQFETSTALDQWINNWLHPNEESDIPVYDIGYQRGVQFVQSMWNEIVKGEEG